MEENFNVTSVCSSPKQNGVVVTSIIIIKNEWHGSRYHHCHKWSMREKITFFIHIRRQSNNVTELRFFITYMHVDITLYWRVKVARQGALLLWLLLWLTTQLDIQIPNTRIFSLYRVWKNGAAIYFQVNTGLLFFRAEDYEQ